MCSNVVLSQTARPTLSCIRTASSRNADMVTSGIINKDESCFAPQAPICLVLPLLFGEAWQNVSHPLSLRRIVSPHVLECEPPKRKCQAPTSTACAAVSSLLFRLWLLALDSSSALTNNSLQRDGRESVLDLFTTERCDNFKKLPAQHNSWTNRHQHQRKSRTSACRR